MLIFKQYVTDSKDCLAEDILPDNKYFYPRFVHFIPGIEPAMATINSHAQQYTEYMTVYAHDRVSDKISPFRKSLL